MKSRMLFSLILLGSVGALFLSSNLLAAESSQRSKSINFEDDVIEGINRKALDSVSQISENDAHKKAHLYKKRATFIDRDQALVRSIAGTQ